MPKLSSRLDLALSGNTLPARALVINLTAQLHRFHDALAEVHLRPDEEAPPIPPKRRQGAKRKS
jgi:hypothetical protein